MTAAALWCERCGRRARQPADGPAVHAATGLRHGADMHPVLSVLIEPELWAAARRITAMYGGVFDVGARFGLLRADYRNPPLGVTMPHHTALTEDEMVAKLDVAVAIMPPRRLAAFAGTSR